MSHALEVEHTALDGVVLLKSARHGDERGFFSEVYNREAFRAAGISVEFVQDNHARSSEIGTLRGLHFQAPPAAQSKLVRVTRGRVLDIVVDIRRDSPTFGRHVAVELSESNWTQIFVPQGFAHGYVTRESPTEVQYKVDAYYAPEQEGGLCWDDPALALDWGLDREPVLSMRDRDWPPFEELDSPFA